MCANWHQNLSISFQNKPVHKFGNRRVHAQTNTQTDAWQMDKLRTRLQSGLADGQVKNTPAVWPGRRTGQEHACSLAWQMDRSRTRLQSGLADRQVKNTPAVWPGRWSGQEHACSLAWWRHKNRNFVTV